MTQTGLTRRQVVLLAGTASLTGLAGCSGSGPDESAAATDPAATASPTQTPSATHAQDDDETTATAAEDVTVVEMITDNEGSYFDPKGVLIEPGTTVRFRNASGSHGTTAYHPDVEDQPLRIPPEAEPWDSPIYDAPAQQTDVSFEVEGVYDYYCPPHEAMGMVGRIVVGEPRDGPGTTTPEELPPGARESLAPIQDILDDETVAGP